MSALLLLLFIINLGIALGAGVYESRIVVPQWLNRSSDGRTQWNAAAAVAANVGLRFWVYITTVPLTLLTFANLFAALQAVGPARTLVARCGCRGCAGSGVDVRLLHSHHASTHTA